MVGRMYYCVKLWIERECLPSIQVDSQCENPYSTEDQRSLKEKENLILYTRTRDMEVTKSLNDFT